MAFVRIEPGSFEMGESKGDQTDEPAHRVEITRPFCLGAFEVTQEQLDRILGRGIETSAAERYLPARGLTFNAAQDVIRRLNDKEPSPPYRLPTEAEWEYAARAGSTTTYSFGDDPKFLHRHGNCKGGDPFDGPAPVGRFRPNDFGLYDMYGNVFEWVSDWYGDYMGEPQKDPLGPLVGTKRLRRGGGWDSGARACSSAARSDVEPDRKDQQNGLRIVREIR
jgi:formylglycine-generating enzyme required for sulfatase activity